MTVCIWLFALYYYGCDCILYTRIVLNYIQSGGIRQQDAHLEKVVAHLEKVVAENPDKVHNISKQKGTGLYGLSEYSYN